MRRRELLATFGAAAIAARPSTGATAAAQEQLFYASVGAQLYGYMVDARRGTLRPVHGPFPVPEDAQSCWQNPLTRRLYVASSDENAARKGRHFLSAFDLRPDGGLEKRGGDVALPARPIHVTGDSRGRFVLTAYNRPATLRVHAVAPSGAVGEPVEQAARLDAGVYPHQVRMFPGGDAVLVPARGNDPGRTSPEDPGSIGVFAFADGQLAKTQAVAPGGGVGFRPRHGDFHPSGRWLYVDLESQNQLQAYAVDGARLSDTPLFTVSTLRPGAEAQPGQLTSAIQVHPNGRHVYVANRATGTVEREGVRVRNGGEDSVAVFDIDPRTGRPTLVQSADISGVHARTMSLSADGRWLVAASIRPAKVISGERVADVAAGLSLFAVDPNGRLAFRSKLDIDPGDAPVFWVGSILQS